MTGGIHLKYKGQGSSEAGNHCLSWLPIEKILPAQSHTSESDSKAKNHHNLLGKNPEMYPNSTPTNMDLNMRRAVKNQEAENTLLHTEETISKIQVRKNLLS